MKRPRRQRNDGLRKICGCRRSNWPKCAHGWHFSFYHRRRAYRFSLDKELGRHVDSKSAAEAEADRIRSAIRRGQYGEQCAPVLDRLTVAQLLETYNRRYVQLERADALRNAKYQISTIKRTEIERPDGRRQAFGDWLVSDVTTDTIERYREVRRVQGVYKDAKGVDRISGGLVTANRDLSFVRGCWNWAIRVGYVEKTPFKRGSEAVIKLSREPSRSRRLEKDEADRLLAACGAHLRSITEGALECGARKGELLSLQWWQVRQGARPELFFPAAKTKTRRDRCVPVSMRLKMILDMRRNDPSGEPMPPNAYVFGNEIGQRITSIKTAWGAARRRAAISDLHFHDLRREAGSRWLEGGVPLQMIRDWLGHSNIAQTSTYLGAQSKGNTTPCAGLKNGARPQGEPRTRRASQALRCRAIRPPAHPRKSNEVNPGALRSICKKFAS
jgi:integrase